MAADPQASSTLQAAQQALDETSIGRLAGNITSATGLNVPATGPNAINISQQSAMTNLLRLGALAATLGVGYRSALGLKRLLTSDQEREAPESPNVVRIPIRRKSAGLENYNPEAPSGVVPFLKGQQGTSMLSKPWAIAALPFLVGGGLYGGYKLTDLLFDDMRKKNTQRELEEAKRQYEAALLGTDKAAGDRSLSDKLDQVFEAAWEKKAVVDMVTGGYLAALLAAGGLAAHTGYSLGRKYNKSQLLQKALERRKALQAAKAPAPVTVLVDETEAT